MRLEKRYALEMQRHLPSINLTENSGALGSTTYPQGQTGCSRVAWFSGILRWSAGRKRVSSTVLCLGTAPRLVTIAYALASNDSGIRWRISFLVSMSAGGRA